MADTREKLLEVEDLRVTFGSRRHPCTRALLSAIPMPDPIAERNKKLVVYDPACHGYTEEDPPLWEEMEPGHYVRGNRRELDGYVQLLV